MVETIGKDGTYNRSLFLTGLYSATTRKHIGYFLKEYYPDLCYQDIRDLPRNTAVEM